MHNSALKDLLRKHPQMQYLDAFYCDLSCVMRGKRYPIDQADKVFASGAMTPGSGFLLGVNGESMDPEGMGISDGDPDEAGWPVLHSLVPSPWTQLPTAQVLLTLQSLHGEPYYFEPRNVLRRVLSRFEEIKPDPIVAFELEFYLVKCKRGEAGELIPPAAPLTDQSIDATQVYSMSDVEDFALLLDEIVQCCQAQGIRTGAISAEYAPGQFEINLQHTGDILTAADHAVMFRRIVQGVARKHGLQATFMAKPYPNNAGSGLHLHLSMVDQGGENAFDGGGEYGEPSCGSAAFFHAIGGLKSLMADSLGIFAPNVNSFTRFAPDIFVPVAPTWGYENRSVAIRIPKSPGKSRRIEHRVAGADANPYLALAAVLAGVHYGITHRIDPGSPDTGNASAKVAPSLPTELETAMTRTRNSRVLADYFGKEYLQAYSSCKRLEYAAFCDSGAPQSDWYL